MPAFMAANDLPRGKPRGINEGSIQSYRSKLRGIIPDRFRNLHLTLIIICVICGLIGGQTFEV